MLFRSPLSRVLVSASAMMLATATTRAATPPGVLVVAQSTDDAVSFDPAEGFELTTVQAFNSLYQRLVQPDRADPNIILPALAQSWTEQPDGRSLVFELRRGATFASGNPVRPEDVIFSLSRATKLNKAPAFILNELGWTADNVDTHLSKIDDSHVKIAWPAKVGSGFVRAILTAPIASIVDQVAVEGHVASGDFGNAWLKTHSAGSGPFAIKAYTPHEALVLAANPSAPGDPPKLKSIVIKNVPDPAARRLLVEQGDADIARGLAADQITALRGKAGLDVATFPSARTDYILINSASATNPALHNPAFWEAARWLVDYDGIADNLLKGQFKVHQSFLPEGFPGALKDNPYKLDVAKARAILAKAGLDNGVTVKVDVFNQPPFLQIAQSLQATFAQAGITLDLVPGVETEVYAKGRTRQYEMTLRFWIPDYFDPNSNASAFAVNRDNSAAGKHTAAWQAGWSIPDLSDKTAAAAAEQDPAKRAALYEALQREVQTASPFVFTLQAADQVVLRSDVKHYDQGLNADQVYYDAVEK